MAGLAVLGAGIFATKEYLPGIKACSGFTLKAVYSRSQKSSETFATASESSIDTYYDSPATPEKSLDALLARADIAAVICALPIMTQPEIIKKALAAGKAVLSEKPVAQDAATGKSLLEYHASLNPAPLWGVAENFRFIESLQIANQKVKEIGGDLVTFRVRSSGLMRAESAYALTEWRKIPAYQGGYLLDGGIHTIAGLRWLLEPTGQDVKKVACFSTLLKENLLPVDTIYATAVTDKGCGGTISLSFGTEFGAVSDIQIVTTTGSVTWSRDYVKVEKGSGEPETIEMKMNTGVAAEVEAFAQSVAAGKLDYHFAPDQTVKDLQLLEALLRSGENDGLVKTIE